MSDYTANQDLFTGAETELVSQNISEFISAGQLVPSRDWITSEIASKPAGTHRVIALLRGRATDHSLTKTQFGEMVRLDGEFEAESHVTGELTVAPTAYLPRTWARLCAQAIDQLPRDADGKTEAGASVQMLLTIGCRSTGKAIPYAWTVQTHMDRGASPEMVKLRQLSQSATISRIAGPRVSGALAGAPVIDAEPVADTETRRRKASAA